MSKAEPRISAILAALRLHGLIVIAMAPAAIGPTRPAFAAALSQP